MKNISYTLLSIGIFTLSCQQTAVDENKLTQLLKHQQVEWNTILTQVMVEDIFTPPVCSRIYVYPNIAAYEVLAASNPEMKSFANYLNEFSEVPAPPENVSLNFYIASIVAFATAAKPLVYAVEKIEAAENQYLEKIKQTGISQKLLSNSVNYGKQVGEHLINYAAKDGYLERTALSQYVLSDDAGKWKPTPPNYMPAIEPHWNTMRTMVLKSAEQFSPKAPTNFSTDKQSDFFKEALEVKNVVDALDEEKTAIAQFWDCNPNISHTKGHLMFYDQKISPGGHWISIAGIAAKKAALSHKATAKVFALTAITLSDAFISCWDEKYRSSLVRPETYINKYINKDWKPLLQTPAFPEHTSGHSVISSAAAVMLTKVLGDNFSFIDSTEVRYGLPVREFNSFYEAADEAAISRLYGGIHYMPAITDGVKQGKAVGNFVVEQLDDLLFLEEK